MARTNNVSDSELLAAVRSIEAKRPQLVETPVDEVVEDTKLVMAPRRKRRVALTTLHGFNKIKVRLFDTATADDCGANDSLHCEEVSAAVSDGRSCDSGPNKSYQPLESEVSNSKTVVKYSYSEAARPNTGGDDDNSCPLPYTQYQGSESIPHQETSETDSDEENRPPNEPSDTDGRLCSKTLRLIKSIIIDILQSVIENYMKELCNGCAINHPSQRQHTCLYDPDSYFFRTYYKAITKKLYTAKLKSVVCDLLKCCGIHLPFLKIQGCIETIVCDLEHVDDIFDRLKKMRTQLYDESMADMIDDAFCKWLYKEEADA